jgi:hypothetical protein
LRVGKGYGYGEDLLVLFAEQLLWPMVEKYLKVPEDRTVFMQSPPPMSREVPSEPEDAPYAGNPIDWSIEKGGILGEKGGSKAASDRKCPVIVITSAESM